MSTEKKRQMRTMSSLHYLYPDVIYRINASFHRIWLAGDLGYLEINKSRKKVAYNVPIFFSKHARSFHWITVGSSMWCTVDKKQSECREQLEQALKRIRRWNDGEDWEIGGKIYTGEEREDAWKKFLKDLPPARFFQEARDREWFDSESKLDLLTTDDFSQVEGLQRDLFALYSGFHHSARKNIEGLVYSFLSACGRKSCSSSGLDYITGTLCSHNGNTPPFEWFDLGESQIGTNDCWKEHRYVDLYDSIKTISKKPAGNEEDKTIQQVLAEEAFLLPLLVNVKEREYPDGKTFGERVKDKRVAMLVPLYDTWVYGQGIGGIWGVVALFFKDETDLAVWKEEKYPILKGGLAEIADELTASARVIAVEEDIKPPYDLVKHFLKVLPFVQDWEEAVVFDSDKNLPKYRYFREEGKDGVKSAWTPEDLDGITGPVQQSVGSERSPIHEDHGEYYLWWTAGKAKSIDLWSPNFIRGLGNEEKARFGKFTIRFKFPPACRIPQGEEQRKFLRDAYLRQQLELMGMLVPKVRARRASLRNAAVSIMSRNMSHNIGSHVIAAVRGDSELQKSDDSFDRLSRLNEHLQRRMDFIAELATTETLYAADNLFYHEVLGVNVDTVNGRVGPEGRGLNLQDLLLKHISGIQNKGVAVPSVITIVSHNADGRGDPNVSFNSGVLGWQALYVILENIIRNVAKHAWTPEDVEAGNGDSGEIRIYIKVLNDHDEFFELRIWDRCGTACRSMRDDSGKSVIEYLANTLGRPVFLEADNTVAKNDWGMKEIYIAAAFLRGISLSDLESRVPKNHPQSIVEACVMDDNGAARGCSINDAGEYQYKSSGSQDNFKHLGFKLWLPKAKTVAIILDDQDELLNGSETGTISERFGNLMAKGIDLFSATAASAEGARMPHRYGVWLSKETIPEERCAELPVNIIEMNSESLECGLKRMISENDADPIIECVRNKGFERRLGSLAHDTKFKIWVGPNIFEDLGQSLDILEQGEFPQAIVFDSHGHGIGSDNLGRWVSTAMRDLSPEDVIDKFAFYESHRSFFPQAGIFGSLKEQCTSDAFGKEALCAALTHVMILDERFQRIAAKPHSQLLRGTIPSSWIDIPSIRNENFSMELIWQRMRVHVPSVDKCDLERPGLQQVVDYIEQSSELLGREAYLVVHQTIFEKLGTNGKELEAFLADKARENRWINVVCSGRGVPWQQQIKNDQTTYRPRFIALSALLQCLEHMPSKLHLIRLLEVTRAASRK